MNSKTGGALVAQNTHDEVEDSTLRPYITYSMIWCRALSENNSNIEHNSILGDQVERN